ncbi:CBS domain-containing protein [Actinobacteria bacterium IMCC26207]|nr:CBS domain-containing protein [Actinobacteria bacterium IMCC26207]
MSAAQLALLAVVVLMTVAAAVLAAAETALTRMTRTRAAALAQQDPKRGGRVVSIVENLQRYLNSLYLSVNVVQTVQAALVGVLAYTLFGPIGLVLGILFDVLLLFVIAEAAPKTWALQHTDRAALFTAPLVELIGKILRAPARGLIGVANILLPGKGLKKGPFVTEDEILALAGEAAEHSVIEESERVLIESIINFGDTIAREIMVPRTDMVTIGADATVSELVDMAIDKGMSRFPVYGENADDIEGVVYVKDAMRAEREGGGDSKVMDLVRPGLFVPETKPVADLLAEMQSSHNHLAVVVDEYGGTAGLATLEDLLEELVGEIHDEFDEDIPLVEHLPSGDVLVNASMNVDDINDELGLSLPEGNWDSVGGLVFGLLGRVAVHGDSVETEGTKIIVELVDGRRVVRVRIVNKEGSA